MQRIPKRTLLAFSSTLCMLLAPQIFAPQLFADAGQHLIPAGSLVSCTTGEAKISSKTASVGDPVLCKVEHRRGDFMLPYGAYLGGEFAEFKDPGHFFGKGWMELAFDRLYVGDTAIPIDAKVVDVPGYKIDNQGRIIGKGHAVRDTITWMIPILWPIDLINLPRRGPRPTLKAETALTLRVMEDIEVPTAPEPQRDPYGLVPRSSQSDVPPPPTDEQPAPETSYAPPPAPMPPPLFVAYAFPVVPYMPMVIAPPPVFYGGFVPAPIAPVAFYGGFVPAPVAPVAFYGGYYAPGPYVAYGYGPRPYGYAYPGRGYAPAGFVGRNYAMNHVAFSGGYRR